MYIYIYTYIYIHMIIGAPEGGQGDRGDAGHDGRRLRGGGDRPRGPEGAGPGGPYKQNKQ